METLIKADIFFFITAIIVVIIGLFVAAGLFYVIRILRDVNHISSTVRDESDKIIEDVDDLRKDLKKNSKKLTGVLSVFASFIPKWAKSSKKRKK